MATRIDWARWVWALGLAGVAVPLGLLAGFEPRLALTAAGAAAFALVAFTDLAGAVAVYVFISFFALHPFGLYDGVARVVLGLACFALIATGRRRDIDLLSAHPWVTISMGLFLGWAGLSIVWAESPSVAFTAVQQWLMCALLFVVVAIAVRTRRDVALVLVAFVLGTLLAALSGILTPYTSEDGRLASALFDPNVLASMLVAAAALSIGIFALYDSPAGRAFSLFTAAFCLVCIWLTGSRGGLVAFGILLIAGIALSGGLRTYAVIATLFALAASVVYFQGFASADLQERLTAPTSGEQRFQEGRTTIWQVAWRAFEENPVQGVGAGNFRVSSKHYLLQPGNLNDTREIVDAPAVVHNSQLEVATELGAVGWVLFIGVIATCFGALLAAALAFRRVGDPGMQAAAISVALALIGTLAAYFFFSDEYSKQLWLLLALGPAMLTIARVAEESGSQSALK